MTRTLITTDPVTSTSTRERVEALAPMVAGLAAEVEAARTLPPALLDQLRAAGCLRMLVPRTHGGDELAYPETIRVLEALARADGSTSWAVMVASEVPYLASRLPRPTFDGLYADGPDLVAAGVLAPKGEARTVDGGYVVSGRWPFASGCRISSHIAGHCVTDDGAFRMVLLPVDEWEVLDTWRTVGMRGTGSHDVVVDERFVPYDHTFDLVGGDACVDSAAFRVPVFPFFSLHIAAVATGIARGAVDDISELAITKQSSSLSMEVLAKSPVFHNRLGEADTRLRAATALLYSETERVWEAACAGVELDQAKSLEVRASAVWIAAEAVAVADSAFHLGGGTSVYDSHPLQRRLRDLHTLHQHGVLTGAVQTSHGAVMIGEPSSIF
jgi:alkylation response protein AidB-like acyl-CoA dehydrogenase